jgi:hypothetical protein
MGQPFEKQPPAIRGDSFKLDFGKNAFRVDEKPADADASEKKLPPEPGRAPPYTSVPWSEILNRPRETEKPEKPENEKE